MKIFTQIIFILVIFFQTGNLLSSNKLFTVNNILLEKDDSISSKQLADLAIKEAFRELTKKVLLQEDLLKVSKLNNSNIKELISYYNISKIPEEEKNKINFNVTFDRDKIHNLFYKLDISYSVINDKDFYILPILLNDNNISIFSNNYFYENWNKNNLNDLIEFILPLENIEIIQNVNQLRDDLLEIKLEKIFKEYPNKNIAIALIENDNFDKRKIYLKIRIQNKLITKNLLFEESNLDKVIIEMKKIIINLVKSQNLIDIKQPSFLNVKLILDKKNNLFLLNSKIKKIDSIENIYVIEFSKDNLNLRMKYLGKLEQLIDQLKKEEINLNLVNDQWIIKVL